MQSVKINVVQHGLQSPTVNGSLDVSKLKKDIEDMGSTMSERAKDFMTTLEQYEKVCELAFGIPSLLLPVIF